jgi:hypothetical protein
MKMNPFVLGTLLFGLLLIGIGIVQTAAPDAGSPVDRNVPGATTGPGQDSLQSR